MKKVISFVAIVALALAFTGCSNKNSDSVFEAKSSVNTSVPLKKTLEMTQSKKIEDSAVIIKVKDSIDNSVFANSILKIIDSTYTFLLKKSNRSTIWQNGNALGTKSVKVDGKWYEYYVGPQDQFNTSILFFSARTLNKTGFPRERCIFHYYHSTNTFLIENHFYEKAGQPTSKTTSLALTKERLLFFISKMEQINKSL